MLDPLLTSPTDGRKLGSRTALPGTFNSDRSFLAALVRAMVTHQQFARSSHPDPAHAGLLPADLADPADSSTSPAVERRPLLAPRGGESSLSSAGRRLASLADLSRPATSDRTRNAVNPTAPSDLSDPVSAGSTRPVDPRPSASSALVGPLGQLGSAPGISSAIDALRSIEPAGLVGRVAGLLGVPAAGSSLKLEEYPRPPGDRGRGFHWIPTLHSDPAVVDRFVAEAKRLGASWMVFLNDGSQIGDNDYLVRRLVDNQIEPVMRIYTPHGQPIAGDLTAMVRHYRDLGVNYFLPYNEPNLPEENPDGQVSVTSYVDRWIPAARAILAGGGLPGLGGLAPGAPVDDVEFLRAALARIKDQAPDLLDRAWISVHNYTFNRPVDYQDDSNGFLKFRWYDQVVRQILGRSLPIISTEGGPRLGDNVDHRYPSVDEARRAQLAAEAFRYLGHREPYFFAHTQWVLANEAGGGHDPAWRADALFGPDGAPTPLARILQSPEVSA